MDDNNKRKYVLTFLLGTATGVASLLLIGFQKQPAQKWDLKSETLIYWTPFPKDTPKELVDAEFADAIEMNKFMEHTLRLWGNAGWEPIAVVDATCNGPDSSPNREYRLFFKRPK